MFRVAGVNSFAIRILIEVPSAMRSLWLGAGGLVLEDQVFGTKELAIKIGPALQEQRCLRATAAENFGNQALEQRLSTINRTSE